MIGIYIIFAIFSLLSYLVSNQLKNKFKKYSKTPTLNNISGRQVVEMMLKDNNIYGIKLGSVEGKLSDHYNPATKTINLSKDVYYGTNIAAAAVAAHETGHAIQHSKSYSWLKLRSALVPVVSFSSKWMQWILLAGVVLIESFPQLLLLGIFLFASTTFFSIITLPVEVDASKRGLAWLKTSGITTRESYPEAKSALTWAAYTYFVAAISSLATLLYYIMIYMRRRN